VNDME